MLLDTARLRERFAQLRGSTVEIDLEPYRQRLTRVDAWERAVAAADDRLLRGWAARLRTEVRGGATTDRVLEELFAVVREVSARVLGQRPYDEQMLGSIVLDCGKIAELQTGEGKTLAAVAPVALQALVGRGAHVLTFNDYLARRDAAWMGPIYDFLGLSVGFLQEGMSLEERRSAYACDVTYLTAKEAGFDFLRDCLCLDAADRVQRDFHFALVDEADSILIDEARVPLVIAGSVEEVDSGVRQMTRLVRGLRSGVDFDTIENNRTVFLTDEGLRHAEEALGCGSLHDLQNLERLADLQNALHAEVLLRRDVDYIVRRGRVELVDDFTGRVADKRQWPDGLQGAIEAKEGLELRDEGRILGSITVQHFLGAYSRLCGMTATARPSAQELFEFYELGVVVIPPHEPCLRRDQEDLVLLDLEAKSRAILGEIERVHASGRPILVGTGSVAESESLASRLEAPGIPCKILNAKNDEVEAEIVAEAGALGAVTISTNMAGRGTDIRLGGRNGDDYHRVASLGGLYVLGTNRHESLRVDQQLRGRAGRQGDPGSSKFFICLEDPLIERFGARNLVARRHLSKAGDETASQPVPQRAIAHAQRIIEGENFSIRRRLWEYSALIDSQRRFIQEWRQDVLLGCGGLRLLAERCPERWGAARRLAGDDAARAVEKRLTLLIIDRCWSDHLAEMRRIRDGIHVVNLVGRDPLAEFYREAQRAFEELKLQIDDDIVATFEKIEVGSGGVDWEKEGLLGPSSTWTYLVNDQPFGTNPMRSLAHRPGFALFGIMALGPVLFLWGLWEHWKKRREKRHW